MTKRNFKSSTFNKNNKMYHFRIRYETLPKQVQWGASYEPDALADYLVLQSAVTPSGLTLLPSHPFLGASRDGQITVKSETGSGVLEIKCPYSINGQLVTCNNMEVFQIVELGIESFV